MENCCAWTFRQRGDTVSNRSPQVCYNKIMDTNTQTHTHTCTCAHKPTLSHTHNDNKNNANKHCTHNRLLFLDETAVNDRGEQARQSKLHEERYTHEENILFGQRRFRKNLKGAQHMTGVGGYNAAGKFIHTHNTQYKTNMCVCV